MGKRMTKTEYRRALLAIQQKAKRCFMDVGMGSPLTTAELNAIMKITNAKLRKLKEL